MAKAIASPDNPLTARVWVNRVWLHHFGAGLVGTPSDFGLRSEPPTHPKLLDWLALRFIADGWSTKSLHRLIMLSRVYQQASVDDPVQGKVDPANRLLWRMNQRRLAFEAMRDSFLQVSGQLDSQVGGRSVDLTSYRSSRRRTLYGFVDRLNLPNVYRAFDFANPRVHSPQRHRTITPQQALFLMNNRFSAEVARRLASRPEVVGHEDVEAGVEQLYRLVYGRRASPDEITLARRYLKSATPEPVVATPSPWQYGYGEYDAEAKRVKNFRHLPVFTGMEWGGDGERFPLLNNDGGVAGGDRRHAAIRRWVAPGDGVIAIRGAVMRPREEGKGVHARIVSSRDGELAHAAWKHHEEEDSEEAEMEVEGVKVKQGDTIGFVVHRDKPTIPGEFRWSPLIESPGPPARVWDAAVEFRGPPPLPLTPWEKYAQTLILANEFVYVD